MSQKEEFPSDRYDKLYEIHSLCVNADGFENHEKPPDLSYSKAEHWRKFNEWKNDKGAHFFAEK